MLEGIIRKKVLREVFSQLCDIGKKKGEKNGDHTYFGAISWISIEYWRLVPDL